MKITASQYAQALYELTSGREKSAIGDVVVKFFELLKKNSQLKMVDKIIVKFNDLYNKENKIVEVEIVSRERIDEKLRSQLNDYISRKYKAEHIIFREKIDQSIKGGIIIKIGDEILDGSLKSRLVDLSKLLKS